MKCENCDVVDTILHTCLECGQTLCTECANFAAYGAYCSEDCVLEVIRKGKGKVD